MLPGDRLVGAAPRVAGGRRDRPDRGERDADDRRLAARVGLAELEPGLRDGALTREERAAEHADDRHALSPGCGGRLERPGRGRSYAIVRSTAEGGSAFPRSVAPSTR